MKRLKYVKKPLNKEVEEKISRMILNRYVEEIINVFGKEHKVTRHLTFLEAKEEYFENNPY